MRSITVLLFLWSFSLNAQKVNLDSLWNNWQNKRLADTSRMQSLTDYIWDGPLYSNPDSAILLTDQLFAFADKKGNSNYIAEAYQLKGKASLLKGDYPGSLKHYKSSLKVREEIGLPAGQGNSWNGLGLVYESIGDFDSALFCYNHAMAFMKSAEDEKGVAAVLGNIGNVHYFKGDFENALLFQQQSLEVKTSLNDEMGMANSIGNIGSIYKDMGDYVKAMEYYNRDLEFREKLNDKHGMADVVSNIGILYYFQGDYEQTVKYLEWGMSIDKELGNLSGVAGSLSNLGLIHYDNDEYERAMKNHTEALEIAKEIGDKGQEVRSLINIGTVYIETNELEKGLEYELKALEMSKEIGYKVAEIFCLNLVGTIYFRMGNYPKAIEYQKITMEMAEETGALMEIINTSREYYRVLSANGDSVEAGEKIKRLIDIREYELKSNFPVLSEEEKEKYFVRMNYDFELFYDFAARTEQNFMGTNEDIFEDAVMIKGLLLKSSSVMRRVIQESGDKDLQEKYDRWIILKQQITEKYAQGIPTDSLENESREVEKELAKKSTEISEISNLIDIDWETIKNKLGDDEAVVEMIKFLDQGDHGDPTDGKVVYYALIVRNNSEYPEMVKLFYEKELEEVLGKFPGNNLSYIEQVYGTKKNSKSQLYELIWKPIDRSLDGAKKVYVSPVGLLHKVSFPALAKEQDVFLCDNLEIQMMSSTGKLALSKQDSERPISYLSTTLFGGIDYSADTTQASVDGRDVWSYLEGTKSETDQINKILTKSDFDVNYYTAKDASESEFKKVASQSNILHIATHGYFYADPDLVLNETVDDSETPEDMEFRGSQNAVGYTAFVKARNPLMRSGLVFASANEVWHVSEKRGEDGVLTAAEVATIDMRNTELVVLSACETGLGDIKGSEGVYGLQRSFKMAGVKYLIMSLWQVPDKETAEFMTSFYKNLTKTNDIKKSFSMTQAEMRKKYDPYYWAAFILVE